MIKQSQKVGIAEWHFAVVIQQKHVHGHKMAEGLEA